MRVFLNSAASRTREGDAQAVCRVLVGALRRRGHAVTVGWAVLFLPPMPHSKRRFGCWWARANRRRPGLRAVVAVGRLKRVREFEILVEAVRWLHETDDFGIVRIWDGGESGAREHQGTGAGLREMVPVKGRCGAMDIRATFGTGAVFAPTSHSRGLTPVVLEASAPVLSVAAAGVSSIPDLGAQGARTWKDAEDLAALAEGLRAYVEYPDRPLQRACTGALQTLSTATSWERGPGHVSRRRYRPAHRWAGEGTHTSVRADARLILPPSPVVRRALRDPAYLT